MKILNETSTFQLISYINKIKAKSKYKLYQGRRVKAYDIKGTPEYEELKKARTNLAKLILGDEDAKEEIL